MFKIVLIQVVLVAAVCAGPIYPGGMGYGMGTSSVSVSRRTDMVSPGIGMMTPGMGMGTMVSSMYGTRMGLPLVDAKSTGKLAKTVEAPEGEATKEASAEIEESPVEVIKEVDKKKPMGQMRGGVMGGMGTMGSASSSRTDVVNSGMGGVHRDSTSQSNVNTPFGSESSVSSSHQASGVGAMG